MSRHPVTLLLSAIGSLGDPHPMLAVALAARGPGAEATMGVAADHVGRATREGIKAVLALPFARFNAGLAADPRRRFLAPGAIARARREG